LSNKHIQLGNQGEDIAAAYLSSIGFRIITRNYRNKSGEIDIVAEDKETLVFVEVKTRRTKRFGLPEEAVTLQKQRQIVRAATWYLSHHNMMESPVRFDIVAVLLGCGTPEINHICSAFDAPL